MSQILSRKTARHLNRQVSMVMRSAKENWHKESVMTRDERSDGWRDYFPSCMTKISKFTVPTVVPCSPSHLGSPMSLSPWALLTHELVSILDIEFTLVRFASCGRLYLANLNRRRSSAKRPETPAPRSQTLQGFVGSRQWKQIGLVDWLHCAPCRSGRKPDCPRQQFAFESKLLSLERRFFDKKERAEASAKLCSKN